MKRLILKILLLLLWCMLSAYLINVSVKLFVPAERTGSPTFWSIYVGTVALMVLYVGIINKLYNGIVAVKVPKDKESEIIVLGNYLLFAIAVPLLIHRLLLHVGVVIATNGEVGVEDIVLNTNYWKEDFPFLLLPLLFTALFFYYWPEYRLFKGDKVSVVPRQEEVSVFDWREYRLPNMLLEQLRKVLDPTISVVEGRIRVFDMVFILYENQNYFAVLTNGEKYLLPRFRPSMLSEWLLGCWFVQINNAVRVNMLYLQRPLEDRKNIILDETVDNILFDSNEKYSRELLRVGRSGTEHIKGFLNNIPTVTDQGWEEWAVEVRS
ncbi:hypothetical protein [Sphingobacterium tabacisoli]|uniref:HTH LytTR-type domain-containing protein n=1 Tax=Sphingobacterium tabacisoli TaxID=2044855 RepID=A0ABW5L5F4_9SPHI|nr:hypothetical protein [Sphingobacterium tabacisoli]